MLRKYTRRLLPHTQALNSAGTGVELDAQGFIKIDNQFQTTHSGIYAIGDAAKQPAFTHVSWEDYRRLKAILCGEHRTRNDRVLGYAVYTEPQLMEAGATWQVLEQSVHIHPAYGEALPSLARLLVGDDKAVPICKKGAINDY